MNRKPPALSLSVITHCLEDQAGMLACKAQIMLGANGCVHIDHVLNVISGCPWIFASSLSLIEIHASLARLIVNAQDDVVFLGYRIQDVDQCVEADVGEASILDT